MFNTSTRPTWMSCGVRGILYYDVNAVRYVTDYTLITQKVRDTCFEPH